MPKKGGRTDSGFVRGKLKPEATDPTSEAWLADQLARRNAERLRMEEGAKRARARLKAATPTEAEKLALEVKEVAAATGIQSAYPKHLHQRVEIGFLPHRAER